jgi:hypothetical protein
MELVFRGDCIALRESLQCSVSRIALYLSPRVLRLMLRKKFHDLESVFTPMKKVLVPSSVFLVAVGYCVMSVRATDQAPSPKPSHPAFEKLKKLEGRWSGPASWDQGGKKGRVDFNLTYRTTSGGRAVMETMFAGMPGEMVTMYFLEGDDLALVHYCSAGNQPKMKLETPRDSGVLSFRCLGGTNMTEKDSHMHWARLELVDADHLKGSWNSMKDGKVEWVAEAELVRQK